MDNFGEIEYLDVISDEEMQNCVEEFARKMLKEKEERLIFWNSPLCETMINDICSVKQNFSEEYFLYHSEEVKAKYGWEHLSDAKIHQFIAVMIDTELGMPEGFEPELDKECYFERYEFIKKGIIVSIMYGQGSSIMLKPE